MNPLARLEPWQNTDGFSKLQMLMMINSMLMLVMLVVIMMILISGTCADVGESDESGCNGAIMRAIVLLMERLENYN